MISLGIAAEVYGPQPSLVVMAIINIALVALIFVAIPALRRAEAEVAAMAKDAETETAVAKTATV
jgi:hypothetical protein